MIDRDFRLPTANRPRRYDLRLEADLERWHFRGSETIDVALGAATAEVPLHSADLVVLRAVAHAGGQSHAATVTYHPEAEVAVLHFAAPLPAGDCRLEIDFEGEILERLRGFYRSTKDGERYAATQFEAADARRAFPCFDEPEFKARFALTLVVPRHCSVIANGAVLEERPLDDQRKEVRCAETPPISSYLVAWCIGPFEATPVAVSPNGWPVRVFLPRGMAERGIFARDAHLRSLTYLEDYTAIAYPYAKVDAIGVPDFEAGAMENPGAITYRLTAIAADAERSSTASLKGIFYTAAHELTHMWWGDLVTMAWWDDLWLNESFATFVGYKTVADLMPEWGMWRDFVATLSRPFALDALVSTHPISFEVKNAQQATERFDVITYWKGAGVVRMIEGFLGADAFRAGVRVYLNKYREGNATADDFWRELSAASGRDVGTIANAWIKEPGHPVVHVAAEEGSSGLRLTLHQERFFADPAAAAAVAPQTWPVPLVLKLGKGDAVERRPVLLDRPRATVELGAVDWVFPNADATGFYRFTLDDGLLARLAPVLQSVLEAHERLALAGNQWALLKAGNVSLAQLLSLLRGFRGEPDRAAVATVVEQLGWLGVHVVDATTQDRFGAFVAGLFEEAWEGLGWEARAGESADERMKRGAVLGALGRIARQPRIRSEARERLERYLREPASLDPNLASTVVSIAAIDGDAALYERYLERKRAATSDPEEEQRFLLALAAFEAPELVQRTLALGLSAEVRPQDRTFLYAHLLGNPTARAAAWDFVRDRWEELQRSMDPMLMQGLVRAVAQLTAEPMAAAVVAFLAEHKTPQTQETIAQAIEQLRIDAATVHRLRAELPQALAAVGG